MKKRELPMVIATAPLQDAFSRIDQVIAENEKWNGPDAPSVRTARLIVAEFEEACRQGSELWETTKLAAEATGWDEQTLRKHAGRKLAGDRLGHEWRRMKVRKGPDGYEFQLSTLPVKPRAAG